jgi:signal transduction histidine kinase
MRERAMLIGATLTIISSSDEGCKVELALPLPE